MTVRSRRGEGDGVRLFDNPLLERLSHVHPATVAVFWSGLSLALIAAGCATRRISAVEFVEAVVSGFLGWTLFEYLAHRFLFHLGDWFAPARRLSFIVHGCHHADPGDRTRNVMPIPAALPSFLAVFALFLLVLPLSSACVLFGVIGFSYLGYDLTHYACHQLPMTSRLGRYLKGRHMRHHFRDTTTNFAVTFPLWDCVFGTAAA